MTPSALERHYTAAEIGELWHLDEHTVRRIFQDEPGVLKLGKRMNARATKRTYVSIRIPASVVERVYLERAK